MSIATIAMVVFFAVFGIDSFWGVPQAHVIAGVAAIVAAVALALGK